MFAFKSYLFEALLLEDKVALILDRQGEKAWSAFEADKGVGKPKLKKPEDVIKTLASWSEKCLQWLVNCYVAGEFSLEDKERIKGILDSFFKAKNKLEKKDLNQYKNVAELEDKLAEFSDEDLLSNKYKHKEAYKAREAALFKNKEAKIFHEGGGIRVIIPKSYEASKFFGMGTKWCTASDKTDESFKSYTARGTLYIVFLDDGRKYQFFFTSKQAQFMDVQDSSIQSKQWSELTKKYPALFDAFEKLARKTLGFIPLIKEPTDEDFIKSAKQDSGQLMTWAKNRNLKLPKEVIKIILENSYHTIISNAPDLFDFSDIIECTNQVTSHRLGDFFAGIAKNKEDLTEDQFNEMIDVLAKRHTGSLDNVIEDFMKSKKYLAWIKNFSKDRIEHLVTLNNYLIPDFESELSDEFKIKLIKNDTSNFKHFIKPSNRMKEEHRWAEQAKTARNKRGF